MNGNQVDKKDRATFGACIECVHAEQEARDLLRRHPHFTGRADGFKFELFDNKLVVRGRVPTFYLKQLLQHALQQLDGIEEIDNRVEVMRPDI